VRILELDLEKRRTRRVFAILSAVNLVLACTTATFIMAWGAREAYSPATQRFITYFLVQGHLATENVLAAWYSSMLLLSVAIACLFAFLVDSRQRLGWMRNGWLLVAAAFVTLSLDEIGSFHERIGMLRSASVGGGKALGWVVVLAVPIATVAGFLVAFAALYVRRSKPAFRWMVAGVALFLLDPLFESVEMALIHGRGADPATWQRHLHDVLLVLEEGGLELFGVLCFFVAVITYTREIGGNRIELRVAPGAIGAVRGLTLASAVGVYASSWLVARLPPGDTGIPSNWFPAAAWLLVFLSARSSAARLTALCLSGYFGAGLYGYTAWIANGFPDVPAMGTILGGWALEGALRGAPSGVDH